MVDVLDKLDRAYATIERLRASNKKLVEALEGMVLEWEKLARYGSPIAKAGNERANAARAAIAKAKGEA
jgi:hypothetical protein